MKYVLLYNSRSLLLLWDDDNFLLLLLAAGWIDIVMLFIELKWANHNDDRNALSIGYGTFLQPVDFALGVLRSFGWTL